MPLQGRCVLLELFRSVPDTIPVKSGLHITLGLVQQISTLMLFNPLGSCALPSWGEQAAREGSTKEAKTKGSAPDLCQG